MWKPLSSILENWDYREFENVEALHEIMRKSNSMDYLEYQCSNFFAYLIDEGNEECIELFVDALLDSSHPASRVQSTHQAYDRPGQIAPLALERAYLVFVIHVPFQLWNWSYFSLKRWINCFKISWKHRHSGQQIDK